MATATAPTPVARACAGTTAFAAALPLAALACEADAPVPGIRPDVVIDTIGDTVVVRTLAGSVWGVDANLEPEVSIGELEGPEEYLFGRVSAIAVDDDHNVYVLDRQAQEILEYDALGNYVRTVARPGEGPGELTRADRMALLPDGRLVVPDAVNGRAQLLGPGPGEREEWPLDDFHPYQPVDKIPTAFERRCIRAGRSASTFHDVKTTLHYVNHSIQSAAPRLRSALLLGRIALLFTSRRALPARRLAALGARGALSTDCCGTHRIWTDDAGRTWILHLAMPATDWDAMLRGVVVVRGPDGTHLDTLPGPAGDFDPPELTASSKPRGPTGTTGHRTEPVPFSPAAVWAGVELSPALRSADDPSLGERIRYDVFEPDGTYLGAVDAPVEFKASVNPVFDGDHVWAVTRDELDVQRVVRYRIVR